MENYRSLCPMNLTLEVFGDKWSLVIIRDIMFSGKRYFSELLHSDEKIASNILAKRLSMLEEYGVLKQSQDPDHKQKIIYSLTEKGIDLLPLMVEIGAWSMKHMPADLKTYKHAKDLVNGGIKAQQNLRKQLLKIHILKKKT